MLKYIVSFELVSRHFTDQFGNEYKKIILETKQEYIEAKNLQEANKYVKFRTRMLNLIENKDYFNDTLNNTIEEIVEEDIICNVLENIIDIYNGNDITVDTTEKYKEYAKQIVENLDVIDNEITYSDSDTLDSYWKYKIIPINCCDKLTIDDLLHKIDVAYQGKLIKSAKIIQ